MVPILAQTLPPTFDVDSPVLTERRMMPRDYTLDCRNLSPPLTWSGLPDGTREIAVVCADFAAGSSPPWVHWIIYGIPGSATGLREGLPKWPDEPLPAALEGAVQGLNGWGHPYYLGPAPPAGTPHLYHFTDYALDAPLGLGPGLNREELLEAMEGHIIGRGEIVPVYERVASAR